MNDFNSHIILNNIDQLVEKTDCKFLIKYFPDLAEKHKEDDIAQHKNLLKVIAEGGPVAFENFKNVCDKEFKEAAKILDPEKSQQSNFTTADTTTKVNSLQKNHLERDAGPSQADDDDAIILSTPINQVELEPYTGHIEEKLKVKRATKFCTAKPSALKTYSMKSANRGLFVLVNIIDFDNKPNNKRNGAEIDKNYLLSLFNQFGFKSFYYENLKKPEFLSLIKLLQTSQFLRISDCLVFAVLSHGDLEEQDNSVHYTLVEFSDGGICTTEEIAEYFNNVNCSFSIGKPKIFLFPCCRGNESDSGLTIYSSLARDNSTNSLVLEQRIATFSDTVICYGTVPGFSAHRCPVKGSWYIECFAKAFANHAHNRDFKTLMTLVGKELEQKGKEDNVIQTASESYYGFHKQLYFNPGYVKDNIFAKISHKYHNFKISIHEYLNSD